MAIAHPLDNPFWVALHDLHGDPALHAGEVLRYPADIAPFLGIADADVAMDDALDILLEGVTERLGEGFEGRYAPGQVIVAGRDLIDE